MSNEFAQGLVEKLEALNNDAEWSAAAKALAKIESEKDRQIKELVKQFAGLEVDEDILDDASNAVYDLAYALNMDTQNMEFDLENGTLDWWVASNC